MRIGDWGSDVCSSDLVDAFLTLLPREVGGLPLRHALEVRHPSFQDPRFVELARRHKVAIVYADHERFPRLDEPTADRKSVVEGMSVSVRVDSGCRRSITQKNKYN